MVDLSVLRNHLRGRFERWSAHLLEGVDAGAGGSKALHTSIVQAKGGYQNLYIFAERGPAPLSASLWERVGPAVDEGAD